MINANVFNNLEKKYDLYSKQLEGISYWMYTRYEIWNYIVRISERNIGTAHNKILKDQNKLQIGWSLLHSIVCGRRIKKRKVDVIIINHERKIKINDWYECKYTESISKILKNKYIFERPYELGHLKPTNEKDLIYLDRIAVKGNIAYYSCKYLFRYKYDKLYNEIRNTLIQFVYDIETEIGVSLDYDYIINAILKKILICKSKKVEYERILKRINPRLVIEVVHYNMDSMLINEIARKMGIYVVELQHGNIIRSHIAYQYNCKKKLNQLPDEIWLLADFWKKEIHMPLDDKKLITVGFPYLENRIRFYKEKYLRNSAYTTVLFISQGTIGKMLSEFAVKFAELCSGQKFRIVYKLHPGEIAIWREKYTELQKCDDIEVIENRDIDLYQLFAESHVQVGVYSTAIYEGLGFGLDTYICDLPYAMDMERLCREGYALRVSTPEILYHEITHSRLHNIKKKVFGNGTQSR